MDPSVLTCYKCPFPKIRLGKDFDGGYIIANIPNINYSILLSGGIANDISFEIDFIKLYNTIVYACDGNINSLNYPDNRLIHLKKNIGYENNEKITNLHYFINKHDSIFIKMDIEGDEQHWIKSLTNEQINKFAQIVIEFHTPFSDKWIGVFDKLNKHHFLIHFHGNNCCGLRNHKGVQIPINFECTYLHKKYFINTPELNTDLIPSNLDMNNLKNIDDININYPPFVYEK
jgi:hypothetical protein